MNANELADELEQSATRAEDHGTIAKRSRTAATMLRQQQAEIKELIQHLDFAGIVVERKAQDFFERAKEVAKQIDNNEYITPED